MAKLRITALLDLDEYARISRALRQRPTMVDYENLHPQAPPLGTVIKMAENIADEDDRRLMLHTIMHSAKPRGA